MAKFKPYSKALSIETYESDPTVEYRIVSSREGDENGKFQIEIPLSIAWRIYYLARAFDGQAVKKIEPKGMTRIDYLSIPLLTGELELVRGTVTDPVSSHYLDILIPLLKSSFSDTATTLIVRAP